MLLQASPFDLNAVFMLLVTIIAFFLSAMYKKFEKMQEDITEIKSHQAVNTQKIENMEQDVHLLKQRA